MADYIDRESLRAAFCEDTQFFYSFDSSLFDLIITKIDEAPAADVAPVVHSNWIRLQHSGTIVCGNCGRNIHKSHGNDYADFEAFCPNCGAKMDGEKQ